MRAMVIDYSHWKQTITNWRLRAQGYAVYATCGFCDAHFEQELATHCEDTCPAWEVCDTLYRAWSEAINDHNERRSRALAQQIVEWLEEFGALANWR